MNHLLKMVSNHGVKDENITISNCLVPETHQQ